MARRGLSRPLLSALLLLLAAFASAQILQYADHAPDGMEVVGDPGLLILFDAGQEGRWLNGIEVFASTPNGANAEAEFQVYVIDLDGRLLRRVSLPYTVLTQGEDGWHMLPAPPMVVPPQFGVGVVGQGSTTRVLQERVFLAIEDFVQQPWSPNLTAGVYSVPESHSYRWSPGTPGEGLWDRDWMVRAYMGNTPDGDREATDLVVLNTGEAFFDRVLSAEGDPLELRTASHGRLPREEVASLRMHAVSSPAASTARLRLRNGAIVEGAVESMDAEAIAVREGDRVTKVSRGDVARIDFGTATAVPIGPQVEPRVSDARRSWSVEQATGPRDTFQGGDIPTAWASRTQDGGEEWLLLGYENAVDIAEVHVWETYNPGAVTEVSAVLDDDTEITLWAGDDPTAQAPAELVVQAQQEVNAKRVKLYLDSANHPGWNEIDAVELVGRDNTRQWATTASASSSYADQ